MSEIKRNKKTGSEYLVISKKRYNADKDGVFEMDLEDTEKFLVHELPLNRRCRVYKNRFDNIIPSSPNIEDWPTEIILILERKDTSSIEIFFHEEGYNNLWDLEFTPVYYYELKEQILISYSSLNPKINNDRSNSSGEVIFDFSISLSAKTINELFEHPVKINCTIGELFEHAVAIDYTIDNRIYDVVEKVKNYIQKVLGGGRQIKPKPRGKRNKDNNSKV